MYLKAIKKLPVPLLITFGLSAHTVFAANLNPDETLTLLGTTVAAQPQLAGSIIEDELLPFSFTSNLGTLSGTVQQRVVRSSLDNSLDFYWRVTNDASSQDAVAYWRVGNFQAPEYNANWRIDGLGDVAPDNAHRFATGSFASYVNFDFGVGIAPGQSSKFIFFDTTATTYDKSASFDLASAGTYHISQSFAAFTPSPVPEPSSILMYISGIAMLFGAVRSRVKLA